MKALLLTRHKLTQAQCDEIAKHWDSVETIDCSDLASRDLQTTDDVNDLVDQLFHRGGESFAIYGVLPAPVRERLFLLNEEEQSEIPATPPVVREFYVYEAWNVKRSIEGQAPTFEHLRWCMTAYYGP